MLGPELQQERQRQRGRGQPERPSREVRADRRHAYPGLARGTGMQTDPRDPVGRSVRVHVAEAAAPVCPPAKPAAAGATCRRHRAEEQCRSRAGEIVEAEGIAIRGQRVAELSSRCR